MGEAWDRKGRQKSILVLGIFSRSETKGDWRDF